MGRTEDATLTREDGGTAMTTGSEYVTRSTGSYEGINDQKDMKRMGKKQELMRNFKFISSVGFTCCVMGTWEILYVANSQALIDGGKAGMFWGYCWVYFGQTFIVLSLAEMASMAPTAGGVSEFAPPRFQKILSYISGWLSTLCWQCFVAADCSICAGIAVGLIAINNADYVYHAWHSTLLIIGFATAAASVNVFGVRGLPLFESMFVALHAVVFIPLVVVLLVMLPKTTAYDVFLNFTQNTDPLPAWPSMGVALMVGQASALFTVQASDSVAHIAEEIQEASKVAPRAMLSAYILNMPIAFGILITFLFTVGDLTVVLDPVQNITGYPFLYPILQNIGPAGANGVGAMMLILEFMITVSTMTSTSRQTFAFARDNGLPFPSWLSRVSPHLHVPINSIVITAAWSTALSLIFLGSTVAFNAFVSVSIVAIMSTYFISISCVLYRRLRSSSGKSDPLPPSRWSLGHWGVLVNSVALAFCAFAFFWCFWPVFNTPDVATFNWAVVIFVGVIILAAANFAISARKTYDGPVAKVEGYRYDSQ